MNVNDVGICYSKLLKRDLEVKIIGKKEVDENTYCLFMACDNKSHVGVGRLVEEVFDPEGFPIDPPEVLSCNVGLYKIEESLEVRDEFIATKQDELRTFIMDKFVLRHRNAW